MDAAALIKAARPRCMRNVRAIIGRNVDVTTTELLRDDVRQKVLAEAMPL